MNHHGWQEPATTAEGIRETSPVADPEAELERLHERLAAMAEGDASAGELWAIVERIRELRAIL